MNISALSARMADHIGKRRMLLLIKTSSNRLDLKCRMVIRALKKKKKKRSIFIWPLLPVFICLFLFLLGSSALP